MPPVDKVMLSCFVANTGARAFYDKMGFETDSISPRSRKLRGGRTRELDYLILSCAIGQRLRDQQAQPPGGGGGASHDGHARGLVGEDRASRLDKVGK